MNYGLLKKPFGTDKTDNLFDINIDFEINDYRFAYRGVSWEKYKDSSWDYRLEV